MDITIPLNWEIVQGIIVFLTAGWTAYQQFQHTEHRKAIAKKADLGEPTPKNGG